MYDHLKKLIEEDCAEMPLFFSTHLIENHGVELSDKKCLVYAGNTWEDVPRRRIVIELQDEEED